MIGWGSRKKNQNFFVSFGLEENKQATVDPECYNRLSKTEITELVPDIRWHFKGVLNGTVRYPIVHNRA